MKYIAIITPSYHQFIKYIKDVLEDNPLDKKFVHVKNTLSIYGREFISGYIGNNAYEMNDICFIIDGLRKRGVELHD